MRTEVEKLRAKAHKMVEEYIKAGGSSDIVIVSRKDLDRNVEDIQISARLKGRLEIFKEVYYSSKSKSEVLTMINEDVKQLIKLRKKL